MQQNLFGKTNLEVTGLGFGAAPIGYLGVDQAKISELLNSLLDAGINLIDTAASYPGSEPGIGEAISHRRDEFVLISKCGQAQPHVQGENWSPELITATIDASLQRLKTDRLDVMLLHSCSRDVLEKGDAVGALVRAREAGKIRFAGYSGDNDAALYAARLDDISVLQMSVNICDQRNITQVLPVARERNLAVMAKRPIANAAWKPVAEQPGMYADYSAVYRQRLAAMNITPVDLGFTGDPAKAWPEIALRFTLSHPGVHTAIIGTTNVAHLKANIAAVERGPLPAEVVNQLREAFDRAQEAEGEPWVSQT